MESTLSDAYRDLVGTVGFELGWGRGKELGDEEWDATKTATIKQLVKRGLRQFYNPPPDQSGVSHFWSFLNPRTSLTLASGARIVELPFDFKGVVGQVAVTNATATSSSLLSLTGGVRARYAVYPSSVGAPQLIEVEPIKGHSSSHGQREQFVVFPQADAAYTLEFNYAIQGEMLSGDRPFAYGGAEHAETILASCLAITEQLDDIDDGPRYKHFMRRLAASISMDRGKVPVTFGFNQDRSDKNEIGHGRGWNRRSFGGWPPLTYNGSVVE